MERRRPRHRRGGRETTPSSSDSEPDQRGEDRFIHNGRNDYAVEMYSSFDGSDDDEAPSDIFDSADSSDDEPQRQRRHRRRERSSSRSTYSRDPSPDTEEEYFDRDAVNDPRDRSPDDMWRHHPTIEEVQSEEIRNLKRQLSDSRRETRQKAYDLKQAKRARRDDRYAIENLEKDLFKKNIDIRNMEYKYGASKDERKFLEEDVDHLSDTVQQYYSAKEKEISKREKTERDLEKAKKKNKDLMASVKEIENGEKYLKTVEKERKRADNYRNMMIKMMQQTQGDNQREDGTPEIWKTCEICILGYDETPERTPRVLGCGHTVCNSCAQQMITGTEVRCPFDRKFTVLQSSDVETLPKNFAVLHK